MGKPSSAKGASLGDIFFIIFAATALRVFLLAWQNQNVIGGQYEMAIFTSLALGATDVAIVIQVVRVGWKAVVPVGLGGSVGVTAAMYLHRIIF